MNLREFWGAGHWPTLLAALLYLTISFMVWLILGGLANDVAADLQLSISQRGLLVAMPLLGGAIVRLPLGMLTDRLGAKPTALVTLSCTLVPLLLGWLWSDSYSRLLVVGLLLGIAGGSFAVALPLAGRWYPPQYQGLALGLVGAGNSGTALATLFAPRLAALFGWSAVMGLAIIPVVLTLVLVAVMSREAPVVGQPKPISHYFGVLRQRDCWWLCLFYAVTFGGFVGLASFLSVFFRTKYEVSAVMAGNLATMGALAGAWLRPVGGWLADQFGGVRVLVVLYLLVALGMTLLSLGPTVLGATLLFSSTLGLLGMGNGAVFQLVPQRFPRELGSITGLVGAAGGLGGFFLPTMLGLGHACWGSYSIGFLAFGLAAVFCAASIAVVSRAWYGVYMQTGGVAALSLATPLDGARSAAGDR
ncbi:MAG: MFS transporter [Gemmatales bacterium]|nr:MFS transporter [Gemmatales bacterium]